MQFILLMKTSQTIYIAPVTAVARRRLRGASIAKTSPTLFEKRRRTHLAIRIGFVALTDCAPLVMAQELGLFAKYGVKVELVREVGWATVRDHVLYRELDAAHAPAFFAEARAIRQPNLVPSAA